MKRIFLLTTILVLSSAVTVAYGAGAAGAGGGGASGGGHGTASAGGHGTAATPSAAPGGTTTTSTVHSGWGPGIDPNSKKHAGDSAFGPVVNPSRPMGAAPSGGSSGTGVIVR